MASRDKIRSLKLDLIAQLQEEVRALSSLETGRLYKFTDHSWGHQELCESYGYIECFNLESYRVKIVASNSDRYKDKGSWRHRGDITSLSYSRFLGLTPVKREELPLLVGLEYRSADFEKILSGKKRIKLD